MKSIKAALISIGIGIGLVTLWTLLGSGIEVIGGTLVTLIFYWSITILDAKSEESAP